ncbi:transporter [Pseudodesulfovibrio sp.]|uniref:transporter n=1 Tax=Pseudodesulfovibrio sp. TaxID=2035812 RepID=UPI002635FFCB|nr:transporter [Pseudodesulfovibrio sp.]MDD3311763.1 transporter [Pseudodesulfovibrio sp.]
MNWLRMGAVTGLLLALLLGPAHAEEAAPTAWGPVGASFGPCGLSIPAGVFAVGGNVSYAKSNGIWESDSRVNGNTKTTKLNEVFKTRYGIIDGLDIRTATPIYNVRMQNTTTSNREVYGVGDTAVLLHKRLFDQKAGDWFSVGVDFGGIVPTGTVGPHSSNSAGNDAWGVMAGVGATYFLGANRFDTEVNAATFTEGARDYQKGDRYRWNLGYAYALNEYWDLGVESSWEMSDESKYLHNGQRDAYVEWYAGPKVAYKYKPWKLNMGLVAKAPVHRWYESNKVGSDDFRLEFKLIKAFNLGALFD